MENEPEELYREIPECARAGLKEDEGPMKGEDDDTAVAQSRNRWLRGRISPVKLVIPSYWE